MVNKTQSMNKENFAVQVKPSKIEGKGAFALEAIPARKKIGELRGEVISKRKARKLAEQQKRIAIVELDDHWALNATDTEAPLKYINHSCQPNTYMRVIAKRVEFYALRAIAVKEELTCNYGETHHDGKLQCNCGAKGCKGFL
jgi:uncharacterized protein